MKSIFPYHTQNTLHLHIMGNVQKNIHTNILEKQKSEPILSCTQNNKIIPDKNAIQQIKFLCKWSKNIHLFFYLFYFILLYKNFHNTLENNTQIRQRNCWENYVLGCLYRWLGWLTGYMDRQIKVLPEVKSQSICVCVFLFFYSLYSEYTPPIPAIYVHMYSIFMLHIFYSLCIGLFFSQFLLFSN